jgi:beta-glucosidase
MFLVLPSGRIAMCAFPEGFLWGASLSAHQAEGEDFNSDWWRWEQGSGRIRDGRTSQVAAGHLSRYREDFALAKKLGHSAHLLSVSWARVQPSEGAFDDMVLAHYAAVFEALRACRLEPVCALHHVAVPHWFAERYGWCHEAAPSLFAAYVERIAALAAGKCCWWIPVLEPMHQVTMQHMAGVWPPQSRSLSKAVGTLKGLAEAHAAAYALLHERLSDAMVGAAVRVARFRPLEETSSWDLRVARREQRRCNHVFLDAVVHGKWPRLLGEAAHLRDTVDFIGVAYYGRRTVRFNARRPSRLFAATVTGGRDTEPDTDPPGLGQILTDMHRYGRPVLITGNGVAAEDDAKRCRYLLDHLDTLGRSLQDGVDVRGYLHRSLLDGFEWTDGYGPRFGLVHVSHESLARTPNPSAYLFRDICETGRFRRGVIAKYCPGWASPRMEHP